MRILRIILAVYLVALVAFIVLLRLAAPGPDGQTIQGVFIGQQPNGDPSVAYFSGKRLRCEAAQSASEFTQVCRIDIAGQELMLYGRVRQDGEPLMNARGICRAQYGGREWPCELQGHFNYPAATVAYVGDLGLNETQLAEVRRRFPIENASEGGLVRALVLLWPVTAVALIVTVLTSWPKARRGKVVDGIAIAVFGVAITLGLPLLLMLAARGFWD